jgi:hypothetical protein
MQSLGSGVIPETGAGEVLVGTLLVRRPTQRQCESVRRSLAGLLVLAVLASASQAAGTTTNHFPPRLASIARTRCPHTLTPDLHALGTIQAALPTLLRRAFDDKANSNGTSYRRWSVVAAFWLAAPAPGFPEIPQEESRVAAKCGGTVAANTWVLSVRFPDVHLINADWRLLIAMTHAGWTIWATD